MTRITCNIANEATQLSSIKRCQRRFVAGTYSAMGNLDRGHSVASERHQMGHIASANHERQRETIISPFSGNPYAVCSCIEFLL